MRELDGRPCRMPPFYFTVLPMIHDNLARSIDDLAARMQNIRDSL